MGATDAQTIWLDAQGMPTPTSLIHPAPLPGNVCPHVRLRLCLAAHLVPYLRPAIVLTNHAGARI